MLSVNNLAPSGTIADSWAPKVLLITAYRWPTTTRLALALSKAGFTVEALCTAGHSLARVRFVSKTYCYGALSPLRSLRNAIAASKPDLIIPSDDTTAAHLHELHKLTNATDSASNKLRSLIAHSLGDPTNYPIFYSRAGIASLAHAAGVLSPTTTNIRNHDELLSQLENIGFPAVLKSDGSFGGMGVAFIRTRAEAKHAFGKLTSYNNLARALSRLIVDRDANLILPCLRRTRPQLSIQPFLFGKRANAAVACWKGAVLAQVCVEVIASNEATGPATVVTVIAHPGMSQAVERLVRVLNLSGLCGFDFILDSTDGSAHLIDFNPRATQTCHLLSSERTQPVLWLAAKLRGLPPIVDAHLSPHCGPIVLFPHGRAYAPQSRYSQYAEIDLPSEWPELVNIGLEYHQREKRLLVKALRFANRNNTHRVE
jgi:ATP-grasp domain